MTQDSLWQGSKAETRVSGFQAPGLPFILARHPSELANRQLVWVRKSAVLLTGFTGMGLVEV